MAEHAVDYANFIAAAHPFVRFGGHASAINGLALRPLISPVAPGEASDADVSTALISGDGSLSITKPPGLCVQIQEGESSNEQYFD